MCSGVQQTWCSKWVGRVHRGQPICWNLLLTSVNTRHQWPVCCILCSCLWLKQCLSGGSHVQNEWQEQQSASLPRHPSQLQQALRQKRLQQPAVQDSSSSNAQHTQHSLDGQEQTTWRLGLPKQAVIQIMKSQTEVWQLQQQHQQGALLQAVLTGMRQASVLSAAGAVRMNMNASALIIFQIAQSYLLLLFSQQHQQQQQQLARPAAAGTEGAIQGTCWPARQAAQQEVSGGGAAAEQGPEVTLASSMWLHSCRNASQKTRRWQCLLQAMLLVGWKTGTAVLFQGCCWWARICIGGVCRQLGGLSWLCTGIKTRVDDECRETVDICNFGCFR